MVHPETHVEDVAPSSLRKDAHATVSVHALSCGHFTLPEYQFIHPVSQDARKTVPSLGFLIQHRDGKTNKLTRIVFDLGLRRDVKRYPAPIQKHIETRQPMTNVHWDHIGEPRDFPTSMFVVGHGSRALLGSTSSSLRGGHSFFESDLLPEGRTIELSDPFAQGSIKHTADTARGVLDLGRPWRAYRNLPQTLDVFNDGSLIIVNAPGHLAGHINLLARVSPSHEIYLGGDACHDRRLLTGEKKIGEWDDAQGQSCCIHADRQQAEETIERIRMLEKEGVEIILAHDVEWESEPANKARFFSANA